VTAHRNPRYYQTNAVTVFDVGLINSPVDLQHLTSADSGAIAVSDHFGASQSPPPQPRRRTRQPVSPSEDERLSLLSYCSARQYPEMQATGVVSRSHRRQESASPPQA
jgi:hypothetical protein